MSLDNKEIRAWLFDELVGEVVRMSKSKYAKFFIIKMLKYGLLFFMNLTFLTNVFNNFRNSIIIVFAFVFLCFRTSEQRARVMTACAGRNTDLMRNKFACDVVECAYNNHANALQRWHIIREFYGKQLALVS